jgi:hypothetical protein
MNLFVNDYPLVRENVLNPIFKSYSNIEHLFQATCSVSYPYFAWNGKVYKVNDGQIGYTNTSVNVKDLK